MGRQFATNVGGLPVRPRGLKVEGDRGATRYMSGGIDLFVLRTFSDVLGLMGVAAAVGLVTGVVSSLTRPPAGRTNAVFGIDNRLRRPRFYKNKAQTRTWGVDLGSIGPALIGAGGAIFVVFATGVGKNEIGSGPSAEIIDSISYVQAVILSIAGGAAGELVFRTLAAGGKVSLASAQEAVKEAASAAGDAAEAGLESEAVKAEALHAGVTRLDEPRTDEEGDNDALSPKERLAAMLHDPKFRARSLAKLRREARTSQEECLRLLNEIGGRQVTMKNGKPGWTLRDER